MKRWFPILLLVVAGAARADAPPMPVQKIKVTCSADRTVCATIDRARGTTTVRGKGRAEWTIPSAPPAVAVSGNGRSLVELYRPGGMLMAGDGPDTLVAAVWDRDRLVRRVRLGDVIARPAALPASVSHRQWSRVDSLTSDGSYVIDTEEGRRVRIALPAGTMTIQNLPGGTSGTWFCRYAQPTTQGPCAKKRARN